VFSFGKIFANFLPLFQGYTVVLPVMAEKMSHWAAAGSGGSA
jgi:hypothetical protein